VSLFPAASCNDAPVQAPLIGIDLADPRRLADRLDRVPSLADELFHPGERAYAATQARPIESLAARFAAKEAVVKALGLDGFDPLDVEILHGGERCGVALHGAAAERAELLGVTVTISLTHLDSMAAAIAFAQRTDST
jgi:holo-[acyl-carrier protein] synthase